MNLTRKPDLRRAADAYYEQKRADLFKSLDEGKKLSDFVGMITRLAFLIAVYSLLAANFPKEGWEEYLFLYAIIVFLSLSIAMSNKIASVLADYYHMEAAALYGRIPFWTLRCFAVVMTLLVYFSIWRGIWLLIEKSAGR